MAGSAQAVVGSLLARLSLNVSAYKAGASEARKETADLKQSIKSSMAQVDQAFLSSERRVQQYTKSLTGDKLLREANAITAATLKAGGASKILASEKEKLNRTLSLAVAQYKRLGQEAPEAMRRLERETRGATSATSGFFAQASRVAGGVALYDVATRAAGALFRVTTNAVEAAGKLIDLRSKTGHSAEMLQRMEFAAKQAGATLENTTDSSFKLGIAIAGGSNSVAHAAKDLGLELTKLQAMKPDQLWLTVTDALAQVEDQQERNRLGVLLMGRSYANVAAMVDGNFRDMAKAATVSTDQQVEELDRLGDVATKTIDRIQKRWMAFLGQWVSDVQKVPGDPFGMLFRSVNGPENNKPLEKGGARSGAPPAKVLEDYRASLKAAEDAVRSLGKSQREELNAALKLGAADAEELERRFFGGVDGALRLYQEGQKGAAKATKSTNTELERQIALTDQLFGRDLTSQAEQLSNALFERGPVDFTTIPEEQLERIKKTTGAAIEQYKRMGAAIPPAVQQAFDSAARMIGSRLDVTGLFDGSIEAEGIKRELEFAQTLAANLRKIFPGSVLDTSELMRGQHDGAVPSLIAFENEIRDALVRIEQMKAPEFPLLEWRESIALVGQTLDRFGTDSASTFLNASRGAALLADSIRAAYDVQNATFHQAASRQFASGFGGMALGVAAAAGTQYTGNQGQRVGQAFSQGANIGAIAGPYGAAIVGGGFALGEALSDSAEIDARREARGFLAGLANQFDLVATAAQRAELAALDFKARTEGGAATEWNKGWVVVRDAYLATGNTAKRALADFERVREAAKESPEAVARAVEQLNAVLSRQAELLDANKQKQQMLADAVARWNLTKEEAGRGFARGELAKQAEGFIQDWKLLTESGANPDLLAGRMTEQVNQFLRDVKAAGAEVPEGMRPLLETMKDLGLLFDESGRKVRSFEAAGIKFGSSLESMFERVLEKLEALITKLSTPLPDVGIRSTTPLSIFTGGQAVERKHVGGYLEKAHTGLFVGRRSILGSTERHIIAQEGEGIISAGITSRLGGRGAINAINMGRFDALAAMAAGMPAFGSALPDSLPALEAPRMAAIAMATPGRVGGSILAGEEDGRRGQLRTGQAGDTYYLQVAPGAINIDGAKHPANTAAEVIRQLPRAISGNDGGLRTAIRKAAKGVAGGRT